MLNESKVKLMTRMAMYESKQGEEDFKISSYYKKDYRSFHTCYDHMGHGRLCCCSGNRSYCFSG